MQRFLSSSSTYLQRSILHHHNQIRTIKQQTCDVFINHRGIDTKRTISGLLYEQLSMFGLNPFLDSKNMKPGDRLFEKIDIAIGESKLGVAVFSPRYCESYFCLHELALIMETKKRVIPIFCDVKPSQLCVKDYGTCSIKELQRFSLALEEAKYTVGLTFNTISGYAMHLSPSTIYSFIFSILRYNNCNLSISTVNFCRLCRIFVTKFFVINSQISYNIWSLVIVLKNTYDCRNRQDNSVYVHEVAYPEMLLDTQGLVTILNSCNGCGH
ncbi:TIR_2 domain-containing protein [Cephalotus follicularis]|uniref:TIR_2 domain-containing protein n=1 Tax=Cephalotus follicularis TaxID=3775 RepID=A0A1Q3C4F7_CEPFO|nr:TIR_2 domain-containing protein [Cephalotus follicularis]